MGDFRFLFLGCWSHLKLWRVEGKSTRLWLLCGLCVQLVSVKNILIWSMCNLITSILEKGTPLVMVDILIFSSEISFLSFFTSSTVWHLFCITWGLNHTSGWAENFPQFRDQLSYELARVAFPGLVFHTEPSLPGSCSYPRNSFVTNMYLMKCEELCEYQTTGKLFCFCPPRPQHLTPVPKLQLESDISLTPSKHVSPGIFGGQQSPHVKHDTSGEGGSKELLPCLYMER